MFFVLNVYIVYLGYILDVVSDGVLTNDSVNRTSFSYK